MAYISRDPVARTELHRTLIRKKDISLPLAIEGCKWCGGVAKHGLYEYVVEHDDAAITSRVAFAA